MVRTWIETTATVALIVTCIAVTVTSLDRLRSRTVSTAASARVLYRPGDVFDLVPPESVQGSPRSIALVIQSGCAFCTESMEFYRRLLAVRDLVSPASRFVVVSLDAPAVAERYLLDHGVAPDAILQFPYAKPARFGGTPTLAVLDADRRIVGVWLGKLNPSQEQEVERALQFPRSIEPE